MLVGRSESSPGLRSWGVGALLGASVPLALGLLACSLGGWGSRHLEAESLVLRDAAGRVRARLVADSAGVARIALLDAQGHDRIALSATAGDGASVVLYDGQRLRLSLDAGPDGETEITLSSGYGVPGARLSVGPGGTSGLELSAGDRRLRLVTDEGGNSQIHVTDATGRLLGSFDPASSAGGELSPPPPLAASRSGNAGVPGRSPSDQSAGPVTLRRAGPPAQRRPQRAVPATP
jgi:hypothetical protein